MCASRTRRSPTPAQVASSPNPAGRARRQRVTMSPFFFFVQLLNAVQYALILYLVASGLTLLLGIMGVINLAHGAFYMVGAYIAFAVVQHFASFWLALPVGILIGLALGALVEKFLLSKLEGSDHLSQVLLSFGLILVINEAQRIIFGND